MAARLAFVFFAFFATVCAQQLDLDLLAEQAKVAQRPLNKFRSLRASSDRAGNCYALTVKGFKYPVQPTGVASSTTSVDDCLYLCKEFRKQNDRKCDSANYFPNTKRCELLGAAAKVQSNGQLGLEAIPDISAVYILPDYCENGSNSSGSSSPGTGSSGSVSSGVCGKSTVIPNINTRIVGGAEAKPHSLPSIGSVQAGSFPFCGSTLLYTGSATESDMVLTAAHCLTGSSFGINVAFGSHDFNRPAAGEQRVRVAKYIVHEQYGTDGQMHDIGLIQLHTPVKFSNTIQPACVPAGDDKPAAGDLGLVAGWGHTREGGSAPSILQQVVVPVIAGNVCQRSYAVKEDRQICAGYFNEGGKDSCQGDSGGPLYFRRSDKMTIYGVVSYGYGCARPGSPGVYTRVSYYLNWINEKIKLNSKAQK